MWPAVSVPMSVCHVTTLQATFRHQPAAATTSDLAVGCPEMTRAADAGLHALGRPAGQQCTSIASSSSARTALITLRCGHSAQKYHIPLLPFERPCEPNVDSPARLSMGEQVAAG